MALSITRRRSGFLTGAVLAGALALGACDRAAPAPEVVTADPETRRDIAQGDLVGFTSGDGAHVWRGIPFAEPPVGDLRWRAPRPAGVWDGTVEALDFGPACPQVTNALDQGEGVAPGSLIGSEDCLTLNIYAPPGVVDGALPVMVWIHGGGNVWGRASQFDGSRLAVEQNVIVVTIQYRLGPLGWFAHGALRDTADLPEDASANFGTMDMIAALVWVRENIAPFGGDAERVTIFGESAGGHNVATLIGSPAASGLFHRAIIQSGSFRSVPRDVAEGVSGSMDGAARTAVAAMLADAGAEAGLEGAALADFLRARSLDAVFAPYRREGDGLIDLPRVINDGIVVPIEGLKAATGRPGGFNAVPTISGANLEETKLFNFLNPDLVNSLFGIFFWAGDPDFYDVSSDYQSLVWRIRAVDDAFARMQSAGHNALYGYRFDWDEEGSFLTTDFSFLVGAAHALEIPFVFGRFQFLGRGDRLFFTESNKPGRDAVSKAMMSYWGQFAHTGDPGTGPKGDLPRWAPYGDGRVMVFDTPADGDTRVIDSRETLATMLDRLAGDDRLATDEERCAVLRAVIDWNPEVAPLRRDFLGGACSR